jgi:Flp pilus assembly protein TadD
MKRLQHFLRPGPAIALLGAVLILFPAQAPAAQVTHTITGRIQISGVGPPPIRLEVTLSYYASSPRQKLFADSGGRFTFAGVRPGSYTISVKAPYGAAFQDGSTDLVVQHHPVPQIVPVMVVLELKEEAPAEKPKSRVLAPAETEHGIPDVARKEYKRGVTAVGDGKLEEAVKHFRAALDVAPDYLYALNDLGVQLMRLKRLDEAMTVLQRAVEVSPTSYQPHQNLALALLRSGKVEDAATHSARALEIEPSSPSALLVSGQVARARGDRKAAIEAFTRAFVMSDGRAAEAQFELARIYEEAEQPAEAIIAYRNYLRLVPTGPQAEYARERLRVLGASKG